MRDPGPEIDTPRLVLRPWSDDDLPAYAAINADSRVMEHFPATLTRAESDVQAVWWRRMFAERGFGMWAVEEKGGAAFIGFVGLAVPNFTAHFTPCVETGWRLGHAWWGIGYASEAATAALAFGFDGLGLDEIVAFTATTNRRSQAVMERLGMTHDAADDFDHPALPAGHPLQRHLLYRLARDSFEAAGA